MLEKLFRTEMNLKDYRNWLLKCLDTNDTSIINILEQIQDKEIQDSKEEQAPIVREVRKLLFFNRHEEQERIDMVERNRELIDEAIHSEAKQWWVS